MLQICFPYDPPPIPYQLHMLDIFSPRREFSLYKKLLLIKTYSRPNFEKQQGNDGNTFLAAICLILLIIIYEFQFSQI